MSTSVQNTNNSSFNLLDLKNINPSAAAGLVLAITSQLSNTLQKLRSTETDTAAQLANAGFQNAINSGTEAFNRALNSAFGQVGMGAANLGTSVSAGKDILDRKALGEEFMGDNGKITDIDQQIESRKTAIGFGDGSNMPLKDPEIADLERQKARLKSEHKQREAELDSRSTRRSSLAQALQGGAQALSSITAGTAESMQTASNAKSDIEKTATNAEQQAVQNVDQTEASLLAAAGSVNRPAAAAASR